MGDYAYVADQDAGLQIIQVRDPEHPVLVGRYDSVSPAHGVFVAGPFIYVSSRTGGLQVFARSTEASQDFALLAGTLEFAAGEMERSIVLPLVHDEVWEPEELFSVALSNPRGGVSLGTPATAAIRVVEARLQIAGWPEGGQLHLRFSAPPGLTCEIEQSLDLVQWQTVTEVTSIGRPQDIVVLVAPGQSIGFYRVVMR